MSAGSKLRSAIGFRLGRRGFRLPLVSQSVWFHGPDEATFDRASTLIALVRRTPASHRVLLTSSGPDVCAWLAKRFPNDAVAPAPRGDRFSAARFLTRMKPSVLIQLASGEDLGRALRAKMSALRIPTVSVTCDG